MQIQIIALSCAVFYSSTAICARLGLKYSTPLTATFIELSVRTITLWTAVILMGGIPQVEVNALILFIILGIMQSVTSLLSVTGIAKIGASRSQTLRTSYPLWSAILAIIVLKEEAIPIVMIGTCLVVFGVILISWKPGETTASYRWWHVSYSLGASFLAGIAFPVRRYALIISNEPLFFAAILAIVSFICLVSIRLIGGSKLKFVWHRKAIIPFIFAGGFETLAALFSLVALSMERVVIVAPLVSTSPLWTLAMTAIFLRGFERITPLMIMGTFSVVAGTTAIIGGR